MPFPVRTATDLPLQAPTYWIVSERRSSGSQPNNLHNDLRALMYLHLWADARGVDVHDRFESARSSPGRGSNLPRLRPMALVGRRPPECEAPLIMHTATNASNPLGGCAVDRIRALA